MLLIVVSIVTAQVLGGAIPTFQLNLWRFLFQAVGALLFRVKAGCDVRLPRDKWFLFTAVLLSHLGFNITFFTAAIHLPAGNAGAYAAASLLAFNVILSAYIKSERVWHLYVSAAVSLFGIVLLSQPWFLFPEGLLYKAPSPNWTSPCHYSLHGGYQINITDIDIWNSSSFRVVSAGYAQPWVGYIMISLSGVCLSNSYLTMGTYVRTEGNPFVLAFWLGLGGSLFSVAPMFALEKIVFPSDPLCLFMLFLHGISSTQTVLLSPFCLQYMSHSMYSSIVVTHTAVLLILQYTVLKDIQPGNGNWVEILGGIIVLAANLLGPITEIVQHKGEEDSTAQFEAAQFCRIVQPSRPKRSKSETATAEIIKLHILDSNKSLSTTDLLSREAYYSSNPQ